MLSVSFVSKDRLIRHVKQFYQKPMKLKKTLFYETVKYHENSINNISILFAIIDKI